MLRLAAQVASISFGLTSFTFATNFISCIRACPDCLPAASQVEPGRPRFSDSNSPVTPSLVTCYVDAPRLLPCLSLHSYWQFPLMTLLPLLEKAESFRGRLLGAQHIAEFALKTQTIRPLPEIFMCQTGTLMAHNSQYILKILRPPRF